jgi:hypothetical protein
VWFRFEDYLNIDRSRYIHSKFCIWRVRVLSGTRAAQSSVFCVVFFRPLFIIFSFFDWPLHCLPVFDLWLHLTIYYAIHNTSAQNLSKINAMINPLVVESLKHYTKKEYIICIILYQIILKLYMFIKGVHDAWLLTLQYWWTLFQHFKVPVFWEILPLSEQNRMIKTPSPNTKFWMNIVRNSEFSLFNYLLCHS